MRPRTRVRDVALDPEGEGPHVGHVWAQASSRGDASAAPQHLVADLPYEVVGQVLGVPETDRVLAGAVRRDPRLQLALERWHRIESDVLLPPGEVQSVAIADHHRRHAVTDHLVL